MAKRVAQNGARWHTFGRSSGPSPAAPGGNPERGLLSRGGAADVRAQTIQIQSFASVDSAFPRRTTGPGSRVSDRRLDRAISGRVCPGRAKAPLVIAHNQANGHSARNPNALSLSIYVQCCVFWNSVTSTAATRQENWSKSLDDKEKKLSKSIPESSLRTLQSINAVTRPIRTGWVAWET